MQSSSADAQVLAIGDHRLLAVARRTSSARSSIPATVPPGLSNTITICFALGSAAARRIDFLTDRSVGQRRHRAAVLLIVPTSITALAVPSKFADQALRRPPRASSNPSTDAIAAQPGRWPTAPILIVRASRFGTTMQSLFIVIFFFPRQRRRGRLRLWPRQ